MLVTPDSGVLVGVGEEARVVNWDLRTGELVGEWGLPGEPGTAVSLTRDGRYLGRGATDGAVDVFRVAEKRPSSSTTPSR